MKTAFLAWIGLALELFAIYDLVTLGRDVSVVLLLIGSSLFLVVALFRAIVNEERRHIEQLSEVARLWKDGER